MHIYTYKNSAVTFAYRFNKNGAEKSPHKINVIK